MARKGGVTTPVIHDVTHDSIVMEQVAGTLLTGALTDAHCKEAGPHDQPLHAVGIMHRGYRNR